MRDPSSLKLGGEFRQITVMFADLSGFTELSAKVSPQALTRVTNQYLAYIVEQVELTGGYVDKFIGDAVMAIWGAPVTDVRHAVNGIQAGLAAANQIRQEHEAAAGKGAASFAVKIGINSGPAVIGNVGTERRYNYTAMGETVNIAARLQDVPDIYGCSIVIGEQTAELAGDEFLLRELDTIRVKGRATALVIFEPIVELAQANTEQINLGQTYREALIKYRAMCFTDAFALWTASAELEAGSTVHSTGRLKANPSAKMAARARTLMTNPPVDWEGVWDLAGVARKRMRN